MKRLLIVGAGGFGREVFSWVNALPIAQRNWEFAGFLDDNLHALDAYPYTVSIIGTVRDYIPGDDDLFLLGVGLPPVKRALVETLNAKGAVFMTLIHPSAVIGANVTIGQGSVICPQVVLTCDLTLGAFVTANVHAIVGHDAVIGDYSTLGPHVAVTGYVHVGAEVNLGGHAAVIPGITVGDGATIGAGSVAIKRVKAGETIFGVPGRRL